MKYLVLKSNVSDLMNPLAYCVVPMTLAFKVEAKRYMAAYDAAMRITEPLQEMRFGTSLTEWVSAEGLLKTLVLYPEDINRNTGKVLIEQKHPSEFYDFRAVDTKRSHLIVNDEGFIGFSIMNNHLNAAQTVATIELADLNECS